MLKCEKIPKKIYFDNRRKLGMKLALFVFVFFFKPSSFKRFDLLEITHDIPQN